MAKSSTVLRARDIDRALVATALDNAYADGQLTFDEHRARIETARAAKTLGDLHALAADLQADVPLPEAKAAPAGNRRRAMLVGAALVITLVIVAVLIAVFTSGSDAETASDSPTSTTRPLATAAGDVTPIVARPFEFTTAAGLIDFRDRYLARFGDPIVTRIYLSPLDKRASLTRVVEGNRTQDVNVYGGFDPSAESEPFDNYYKPFDIIGVDFTTLAGLMAGAASFVEVPDATITTVLIQNTDNPEILVSAENADGQGGSFEADFAGTVTRTSPYRP